MNTVTSEAVSIDARARAQSRFWLGVDGGGTNSRAAIVDEAGTIRGDLRGDRSVGPRRPKSRSQPTSACKSDSD